MVDILQTIALALIAAVQIYTIMALRRELRHKSHTVSMLISEQNELRRRIEEVEGDVAQVLIEREKP